MRGANGLEASFLARVDPSVVDAIRRRAVVHHHPGGAIVVSEDDGKWVGIVLSGMARVFLRTPDGRQVTLRHARAGGSIGIGALLGKGAVSAQAVTELRIMRLDHEQVARIAERDSRLALAIATELSVRLMETYNEIVVRERGSLRQRLARQLLHLAGEHGPADQPLVLPMSHEDLADAVGSAREVVSRHLARLQSEEIVALDRGRITLIDPLRLHETAQRLD